MLHIADIMTPEAIAILEGTSGKKQALLDASHMLAGQTGLSDASIFRALIEREALGSTGFGGGVAVPHARVKGLERTHAVFIRLVVPVDYSANDEAPVDLICAIIGPEGPASEPFEALVSACRALRNPETVSKLRKADCSVAVQTILTEGA
jgi:PTS system nitrogen regulatory IIA component